MVAKAGAGPPPLPSKSLTAGSLAEAITAALKPDCIEQAKHMKDQISKETGSKTGAAKFHDELHVDKLRCQLSPSRPAAWRIRRTDFRLSACAATILAHEKLLDFKDLKLYRPKEYDPDSGPWDPITGGATALVETIGGMAMGIADMPVATLKALKIHPEHNKGQSQTPPGSESRSGESSQTRKGSRSQSITATELQNAKSEALQAAEPGRSRASSTSSRASSNKGEEAAAANALVENAAAQGAESATKPGQAESSEAAANKQKPFKFDHKDMETMMETGKGAWKSTEAGIRAPLDFTLALAKGFHNAPKLYGDDTVREPQKITNLSTGLKAAGKEFGYGLYDGITGLVTQPLKGAQKEGAPGFVKGFAKGIGGIALKPGAGFWALPGFAAQGVYRELRNRFGPSVEGYIIAARTAQGFDEMGSTSSDEYSQIIKDWDDIKHLIRKKKHVGEEKMEEIKSRMRDVKTRSRSSSLTARAAEGGLRSFSPFRSSTAPNSSGKRPMNTDGAGAMAPHHSTYPVDKHSVPGPIAEDPEIEEAIQRSIAETSQGNAEEDREIEQAVRASLGKLERARAQGLDESELQRAMTVTMADVRRENIDRHASQRNQYPEHPQESMVRSPEKLKEDEDLERAIAQSRSHDANVDDEQLKLAVQQSLEAHEKHATEQQKAKDEEEVVMNYMMKQSKAEEDLRNQRTGESSK